MDACIPAQIMRPAIGQNVSCAVGDFIKSRPIFYHLHVVVTIVTGVHPGVAGYTPASELIKLLAYLCIRNSQTSVSSIISHKEVSTDTCLLGVV